MTEESMPSLFVNKNNLEPTVRDIEWLYANLDLNDRDFIVELLRQGFPQQKHLYASDEKLASACKTIAGHCDHEFQKNVSDQQALASLLNTTPEDSMLVMCRFRNLWRGYTESELGIVKASLSADQTRLHSAITSMLEANNAALNAAKTQRNKHLQERLEANHKRLVGLMKPLHDLFAHPDTAAKHKMVAAVRQRRHGPNVSLMEGFGFDAYLYFEWTLRACDPAHVDFPLRFLWQLPVNTYSALRKRWKETGDTAVVVRELGDSVRSEAFHDFLARACAQLAVHGMPDRTDAIQQASTCFHAKCSLAATLVAITQTEGLLWDFADHLNAHGVHIYQTQGSGRRVSRCPYNWDPSSQQYGMDGKNQHVLNTNEPLLTARNLLERTPVGKYMPEHLFGYLVDEFYDDRINITHGTTQRRDWAVDEINAFLCLQTVLRELVRYFNPSAKEHELDAMCVGKLCNA